MFYFLSTLRYAYTEFNIFRYITFRCAMAAFTTFMLCVIFGPIIIRKFKERQIQEKINREDCPQLDHVQSHKKGTPTMGGIFMIGSILISVLLWADLGNRYILLTILTCVWLAILGGVDDYIKLTHRQGIKRGLGVRVKLLWEILLGVIIGICVYLDPNISTKLDIPFLKNAFFDLGLFFIPFVALVIIGSSNSVNLTDGLDGLAIGCVLIVSFAFSILSYITGHMKFSQYLLLPYIAGSGELAVFCSAILGASLGFLWFNSYPASIFMGDVGSLSLGGMIGVIAVFIKKEILLILVGGIFVVEAMSVILQVLSFKTRRKRIFKVAPLHHHLQLCGWSESKIIIRFWIVAIILALLTLTTLKIR